MRAYDIVKTRQDLTHLQWSERASSSGTAGCFLKSREQSGTSTWYYKLSCYDSYRGVYGHECANEIVASRLMALLGIPHLDYRLVHALIDVDGTQHDVWLNRSRSFRKPKEKKLALDTFYDLHKQPGESPLELCARFGWSEQIERMMLVDYLIINRDRHGANIEVLQDARGNVRLAPLFDNGLSFVFSCYSDCSRVARFDPLDDVNANNYLGTRSLEENLHRFVSPDLTVKPLRPAHREQLLAALDEALPSEHRDKIWDIIWQRWCHFENIRIA